MSNLSYTEFIEEVKANVSYLVGDTGKVNINHVVKNNGCELDGLVILREGSNISPTIYLNEYYELYKNNMEIAEIAKKIEQVYELNVDKFNINPEEIIKFENIKDKIAYKIVNYKKNEKLLEKVPHKKILDLAFVYYCILDQQENSNATFLINQDNLKTWGVDEAQVSEAAFNNTEKLLPHKFFSMSCLLEELSKCYPNEMAVSDVDGVKDMYVLTNDCKINGASCIFYNNVLHDFAESIGSDLYILPSSVHEVIILPKINSYKKADLYSMVTEVNSEGVPVEEVLSDNVYVYSREDRRLTM